MDDDQWDRIIDTTRWFSLRTDAVTRCMIFTMSHIVK